MINSRLIIDVRESDEYSSGHIEGAINVPPSELLKPTNILSGVHKDTPIILYCRSGSRSEASLQILKQKGYTNLTNGINSENVKKNYLS